MACCRNCKFFQLLVRPDGKCLRLDGFTFEGIPACALFEERDYVKHELFGTELKKEPSNDNN